MVKDSNRKLIEHRARRIAGKVEESGNKEEKEESQEVQKRKRRKGN